MDDNTALRARIEQLTKALEFYENMDNYIPCEGYLSTPLIFSDNGLRARSALLEAETSGETGPGG